MLYNLRCHKFAVLSGWVIRARKSIRFDYPILKFCARKTVISMLISDYLVSEKKRRVKHLTSCEVAFFFSLVAKYAICRAYYNFRAAVVL
jgi:hypothetical protein